MNRLTRPNGLIVLALIGLIVLASCGKANSASETPSPESSPETSPDISADISGDISATSTAAPPAMTPELTLTLEPSPTTPPPTAEPTPAATTAPTATPDMAGIGLPCPATTPVKPDYVTYRLSADLWPEPDSSVPLPPLSLADPLPAAGRNAGYPYGSDGSGRYLLHNGLDMASQDDSPAVAVADGQVIVARDDVDEMFGWRCDWYGQLVVLQLDDRWDGRPVYALYGHVKDLEVSEGQRVERGEPVAREGAAGVAVVPHLHLEIRVGENTFGATRNPLLWIKPWSGSGVIAGRLLDPDGRAWQGVVVTLIDRTGEAPFLNTWTYLDDPDHLIQPDPALGENFVFGPVAVGNYDVYTKIQGVEYRQTIEVFDGELATLEIVTEPYRTPTPETTPSP